MAFRKFIPVISTKLSRPEYLKQLNLGPRLGGGSYGEVFAHPTDPNKVIKITYRRDRAYNTFMRHVIRLRKHCSYFPVVYSAKMVFSLDSYRVRQECPNGCSAKELRQASTFLIVEMERLNPDTCSVSSHPIYKDVNHQLMATYRQADVKLKVRSTDRGMVLVYAMLNRLRQRMFFLDLHNENWMFRGDQLVLTDPAA